MRGGQRQAWASSAALLAIAASLVAPAPALGLELTVDSSAEGSDAAAGNGVCATAAGACTLRAAFEEASLHDAPANQDSISVPAGEYVLTRDTGSEDFLVWGGNHSEDELTVTGAGSATTTIKQTVHEMRVLFSEAPLHLIGLTITGGDGGGTPDVEGMWGGGGIASENADLTLTQVSVTGNHANEAGGGGIRFDHGAGGGGTLRIVDSLIADNTTFGWGGGIEVNGPMIIEGSRIVGNVAEEGITAGGGIHFNSGGGVVIPNRDLRISDSTIADNEAFIGGGIQFSGNELRMDDSTVSGNSAFEGGGIRIGGKTAAVENSTISGNMATRAGGIQAGPELTLRHVTIAENEAQEGAGIKGGSGSLVRLQATILSENDCGEGTFESLGFNLESGDTCFLDQPSDLPTTSPQIGPLQDNGGPTRTHLLLPSSPAIDAAIAAGVATDQRGLPRPLDLTSIPNAPGGDGSDIGALELQALPPAEDGSGSSSGDAEVGSKSLSPAGTPKSSPSRSKPDLDISAKRRQRAGRLRVRIGCEAVSCSIRLAGRATLPPAAGAAISAKSKRSFKLQPKTVQLSAGATATVRLRFKRHRAAIRAISRLLEQGGGKKARKGARVTVRASATDAGTSTVTIKLKGWSS